MKITLSNILKFIISLGLGFGLVWFLNSKLSPEQKTQIIIGLKQMDILYIVVIILLAILACIVRAYRWNMLLKPMGYNPRKSTLIASIFIMYLGNLLFPRLGEVLRCSVLLKEEDIPLEKSIGTMITERLIDVLGLGLYVLLAIIFEFSKLKEIYNQYNLMKGESSHLFSFVFIGLCLFLCIFIWFNPKLKAFILDKIKGLLDGLKSILKLESPVLFIIYSLSIYAIYFFTTYILYFAFTETSLLSISSGLVVLIAGTLGVGLTQGGIGAYQLLVTWTLELYNIPTTIAQTYSWAAWIIPTFTLVFFGLISWIYIIRRSNGQGK